MDEDFICPMVWKWSDIYADLQAQWQALDDETVPQPPAMLAPNATDNARQQRWAETVAWADQHGMTIPELAEHEKHTRI